MQKWYKRIQLLSFFLGITLIILGMVQWKLSPQKKQALPPPLSSQATLSPGKDVLGQQFNGGRQVTIAAVLDGDTVETTTGEKIRYLGINAPEKGQPFSSAATQANKGLVLGKVVSVTTDVQTKDRYGRTLGYVYQNNVFVNLEMVKKGLAISETIQPNVLHQDDIVAAQKTARTSCVGLWNGLCGKNNTGTSCIKISEITADPPGDDTKNKNGEYVTVTNTCSNSISLNGWLLKDNSASNTYTFHDFSLEAKARVLLHSGCGDNTADDLYWQCPEQKYAVWNNTGDHAFLYDATGKLVSDYQY